MPSWLSRGQRDILIDHLDGIPVPIIRASGLSGLDANAAARRMQQTFALVGCGMLKTNHGNKITSTHTTITDRGRAFLAEILADWADALVRARRPDFDPTGAPWGDAGLRSHPFV